MQALHTFSGSPLQSLSPQLLAPNTATHLQQRLGTTTYAAKKAKGKKTGAQPQPQPQQQQQPSQTPAASWLDPRLQWARPEWIHHQQQSDKQQSPTASLPPAGTISNSASQNSPSTQPRLVQPAAASSTRMTEREQRYLQQRLTYSSFSSSDEETGSSAGSSGSSSSTSYLMINPTSSSDGSTADIPQPFQAMGIDFGLSRVGVAVRQSTHNIPLTTIDRRRGSNFSSSSSSSKGPNRGSSPKERFDREMHLNGQVAHALLTTALEQGCDGFVVGLPVYTLAMQKQELDADLPASSAAAVAAVGAAASDRQLRWNGHVRRFAQVLADVAAAYELPVLLVNEQQSTKQASAVRSGKAAYDIVTLQELQQQQQQQQQPPQQQPQQGLVRPQQKRQADPGRDAYAAALILSRYYNDLVPVEVVPARPQQQQWRRPQLQEQQQQQRMERMQDQQGQMLPKQPRKPPRYLRQKQQQQ